MGLNNPTTGGIAGRTYDVIVAQDGTGDYNGTTKTPISNALAALAAAGGGKMLIRKGTYTCAGGFNLTSSHSNITIEGEGWTTILKMANGSNDQMFDATSADNVRIANLKIDGNGTNQTSGWGILTSGCKNWIVENVWIYQPRRGALGFGSNSINCRAINCRFEDKIDPTTTADLAVISSSKYSGFIGCYSANSPHQYDNGFGIYSGISPNNTEGCFIIGCISTGQGGNGINFETASKSIADGNICFGNSKSGVAVNGGEEIIISNNQLYGNTYNGIEVNSGSHIIITGNQIHENEENGIYTSGDNVQILNNQIHNNNKYGINAYNQNRSRISNNQIFDNNRIAGTYDGIRITNGLYCDVSHNDIYSTNGTYKHNYGIFWYRSSGVGAMYGRCEGNHVYNSSQDNIRGYQCTHIIVTGNECQSGTYGIKMSTNCNYWIIKNNILLNNSSSQLQTTGANNIIADNIIS